jgi:hypothetical protein
MGTLPTLLVRSIGFALAALVLTAPARAQMPFAARETEAAADPATDPAATPEAPTQPTPPPVVAEPRAETGQPAPAKADTLKQATAPSDESEEYFEDEAGSTERPKRKWYGWQTLVADGISTTVFFAAFNDDDAGGDNTNEALAWAGIFGYELAPAVVHFAHKNPGRGFASMGIRLGMPLAGAFLGGAAASACHGQDCTSTGIGLGFLLGMGGAIAIDAALLAFDYPESTARSARRAPIVPLLSLSVRHAFIGVQGAL